MPIPAIDKMDAFGGQGSERAAKDIKGNFIAKALCPGKMPKVKNAGSGNVELLFIVHSGHIHYDGLLFREHSVSAPIFVKLKVFLH